MSPWAQEVLLCGFSHMAEEDELAHFCDTLCNELSQQCLRKQMKQSVCDLPHQILRTAATCFVNMKHGGVGCSNHTQRACHRNPSPKQSGAERRAQT